MVIWPASQLWCVLHCAKIVFIAFQKFEIGVGDDALPSPQDDCRPSARRGSLLL